MLAVEAEGDGYSAKKALASALGANRTLRCLEFSTRNEGTLASLICWGLTTNSHLIELCVSWAGGASVIRCRMLKWSDDQSEIIEELATALRHNSALEALRLRGATLLRLLLTQHRF